MQELSLQHITNILWTYASFLHDVPNMLPAFTCQILERTHSQQFNAQQLSNLLWSLCILQVNLSYISFSLPARTQTPCLFFRVL